jgi:hydrogenase nickel incorporation protein HypA/HybF
MHEFSTMSQIVRTVLDEAARHRAQTITRVVLELGELTFLGEEQLRFAFEVLSKGTILEGASLVLETKAVKVQCPCGYTGTVNYEEREEFHLTIPLLKCPRCSEEVRIIQGRECIIKNLTMEVDDVPAT